MSAVCFEVEAWSAWAPGLESQEEWLAWAQQPFLPQGEGTPALAQMQAMARRRVERLGRAALQTAYEVVDDHQENGLAPLVFASRHGDIRRTESMLRDLAETGAVSPTAFSLAVHNAIGALFSIVRADTSSLSALSAGMDTAEAAVIEACGLLQDGAESVVVVVYDDVLPDAYAPYADEPLAIYAWALRLRAAVPDFGRPYFALCTGTDNQVKEITVLPRGLQTLQFLLSQKQTASLPGVGQDWLWSFNAGG